MDLAPLASLMTLMLYLGLKQAVMDWLDVDFEKTWNQTMNAHPQESNFERRPALKITPYIWSDRLLPLMWEIIRPGLYIASDVKSEDLPCDLLAGALEREGVPIALPVVPILFSEHRDPTPVPDILYMHRGSASRFQRDPEFRTKMRRLLGWDA